MVTFVHRLSVADARAACKPHASYREPLTLAPPQINLATASQFARCSSVVGKRAHTGVS